MAPPAKTAVAGKPVKAPVAKPTSGVGKKASFPKKVRTHPPYFEMVKEAIMALKERTGSSPYAIAKFTEEKQKENLPANFKKLLSVQLKKLVASGKLVKVKNSFKLAAPAKPTAAVTAVKKQKNAVVRKKPPTTNKRKRTAAVSDVEKKKPMKKVAAASKVKKTPTKKVPVKKTVKPKSIKSPAKKMKK
ncbi:hypothetical protein ACH5RR_031428 [Cinchona calisaya]|uniref:H15 domain-containing protein n=1 Tax=Cinchona calisaya TaxID=153742 RepID=A0ABD2YF83_9GENT